MAKAKNEEPMIGRKDRPTAIDFDDKIADWKVKDLLSVVNAQVIEQLKYTPFPEHLKPEQVKPEYYKPEHLKPEQIKPEHIKPERIKPEILKPELIKPEKERLKPEKEFMKPELSKPEKEFDITDDLIDRIATRVVELMQKRKG